jgi:low affinity Fe/Cu permease
MQLNILIPVLMYCAMLWWIGRRFSWTTLLAVTAITLVVIICVLLMEGRGPGFR